MVVVVKVGHLTAFCLCIVSYPFVKKGIGENETVQKRTWCCFPFFLIAFYPFSLLLLSPSPSKNRNTFFLLFAFMYASLTSPTVHNIFLFCFFCILYTDQTRHTHKRTTIASSFTDLTYIIFIILLVFSFLTLCFLYTCNYKYSILSNLISFIFCSVVHISHKSCMRRQQQRQEKNNKYDIFSQSHTTKQTG